MQKPSQDKVGGLGSSCTLLIEQSNIVIRQTIKLCEPFTKYRKQSQQTSRYNAPVSAARTQRELERELRAKKKKQICDITN